MTRSRQKHNFRSWQNRREREIEARKWGHTDTARLIVCAPTWERGGGRHLPRSGITGTQKLNCAFSNYFKSFLPCCLNFIRTITNSLKSIKVFEQLITCFFAPLSIYQSKESISTADASLLASLQIIKRATFIRAELV